MCKMNIIEAIDIRSVLDVIVYNIRGPASNSVDGIILLINELTTWRRILIVVYFNPGKMLPENITIVGPLIQIFNLC